MAYPNLDHVNHTGVTFARVGDELRATVAAQDGKMPTGGTIGQVIKKQSATNYHAAWEDDTAAVDDAVAGGAGFVPVSGIVTLDLATPARAFHHTMVATINTLAFANLPNALTTAATWTWVLRINATGGYSLPTGGNLPAVTFVDGRSFAHANMAANAVNIFTFWMVGADVFGALVTNGELALDARELCFLTNQTIVIPIYRAERLDPANTVKTGNGAITYFRTPSGGSIAQITGAPLPRTLFSAGDVLSVQCSGMTTTTGIAIPRFTP